MEIVKIGLTTPRGLADVFTFFDGNTNSLGVRVFLGKWNPYGNPDLSITTSDEVFHEKPAEALAKLKAFLEAANVATK
jgi:hypothetical protein